MLGRLASAVRLYADWRMAKILFLGFVSGFPWLLIGSMVSLWLKEEGLSRTGIGLFGLVFGVYAVNALWAPLVDGLKLPFLTAWLGRRRAWLILMQTVMLIAMFGIAMLPSATGNLQWLALFAFIIALASATQDVAIDATRIEMMREDEPNKIGAGSAMATSGWWLGFGGGKALVLPYVDWLQGLGVANAWQMAYLSLTAAIVLTVVVVVVFIRIPDTAVSKPELPRALLPRALALYILPIKSFMQRYALSLALALLAFIFFFKIGEAFLGRMSLVFYKEVGFSKSEIGLLSGGVGTITVCVFAVMGGFFNAHYGLFKGIVLGGLAMALTNLLFAALAVYPEKWLFVTAVVADQFTTAVSTVAFVAFLSQLCDRAYTATQYAALASIGNLSRTVLATGSGAVVDFLGGDWATFFILTVLMVLPSLAILWKIRRSLASLLAGATARIL